MFLARLVPATICKTFSPIKRCHRNVQISIVNAGSNIGSKVALMLKRNHLIRTLHLYDEDPNVDGLALEISLIPEGPYVSTFIGESDLPEAIAGSDLIVVMPKTDETEYNLRTEMFIKNVPSVIKLCKAVAEINPSAFIAIAEEPINSIVPCASAVLDSCGVLDPARVFGITQIDNARTRAITASFLKLKPSMVNLPVIGGHSPITVVPIFSNLSVDVEVDKEQKDWLTRLIRKNVTDHGVKKRQQQDTLSTAFAIHEFIVGMATALKGGRVVLNTFAANNNFDTKYFGGPTELRGKDVFNVCTPFQINDYENTLLKFSKEHLIKDILAGENYITGRV